MQHHTMQHHTMNINIWYHLPDKYLNKLPEIFSKMDGWLNPKNSIDYGAWYSEYSEEPTEKFITCHHEPSGLHFSAYMKKTEWEIWKRNFKKVATEILGFKVGEPEEGDYEEPIE